MSLTPDLEPLVLPSRTDPVARGATGLIGGPPGAHARVGASRWLWTPIRVLIAFALMTAALGFAQKAPCRTHAWEHEYQYTRMCYSDVLALYYSEGLADGQRPYVDHPVEYPVVIGEVMEVGRVLASFGEHGARPVLVNGVPQLNKDGTAVTTSFDHRPSLFFDLTTLLLAIAFVVVVITSAKLAGRRRPWDAAMVALAPAVVLHLSTNWDLLAVALTGIALVVWQRKHPAIAGVVLGLGVATKLYPILLLVPLLLICARAGRMRAWLAVTVGTLLGALAAVIPGYFTSSVFAVARDGTTRKVAPSAWHVLTHQGSLGDVISALAPHQHGGANAMLRFVTLNETRPADWDSLFYTLQHFTGVPLDQHLLAGEAPRLLNTLTGLGFLLLLGGIVWVALRAPRRPRLGQLAFLVVVAFLLTSKVFSPQYTLWLLPLAVMARPRWRMFLVWQLTEGLVLLSRFLFFVHNDTSKAGIDVDYFLAAVVLRDLALVAMSALVVREIWRPDLDVVRQGGVDDPAGGLVDGVPDARSASWARA